MTRDVKNLAEKESEKRSCCGYDMRKPQETLKPGGCYESSDGFQSNDERDRLGSDLFTTSLTRFASSRLAISSLAPTRSRNPRASKSQIYWTTASSSIET